MRRGRAPRGQGRGGRWMGGVPLDQRRRHGQRARRGAAGRNRSVRARVVAVGGTWWRGASGVGADPPVLARRRAYYAESKAIAENDALAATSQEMAVVVIRPHLVWGPGDEQLVGRIVERARTGRLALVAGGRALVDTTY